MFDDGLTAAKLRRWEKYLENYRLPAWEEIPDIGLYMEQVVVVLRQYLDYLPPELKDEQCITAASINNYVRTRVMPKPVKKRYYRTHLAYLIMICSLKQGMSIPLISRLIPATLSGEELRAVYTSYTARHRRSAQYFAREVRGVAAPILGHEEIPESAVERTEDLIVSSAVVGSFARLLAEKLVLLEGKTAADAETGPQGKDR